MLEYSDIFINHYLFDLNLTRHSDTIIELDVEYNSQMYILDMQNQVINSSQFTSSDTIFISDGSPSEMLL